MEIVKEAEEKAKADHTAEAEEKKMDVAQAREREAKAIEEKKEDEKKAGICDGAGNGRVEYCGGE